MSTSTVSSSPIAVPLNHLRRAFGHAVSWGAHDAAVATGPADLDLPFALAASMAAPATAKAPAASAASAGRAPEVSAPAPRKRKAAPRRTGAVRR